MCGIAGWLDPECRRTPETLAALVADFARTGFRPEEAEGEGGTPNGKVAIEQEMIKLSDTQIHYQTATNLYQKAVGMFRTALGTRS